jgi:hypothetical protein
VWQKYNHFIEAVRSSQSGFPLLTPTMQAGQDSDGGVGGNVYGSNVYAACSDYVVIFAPTLMIQPQAPKCSRQSQLNLLFWGIVPCVYKIYTLDLFHCLL